jgi:hypothetical protein
MPSVAVRICARERGARFERRDGWNGARRICPLLQLGLNPALGDNPADNPSHGGPIMEWAIFLHRSSTWRALFTCRSSAINHEKKCKERAFEQ